MVACTDQYDYIHKYGERTQGSTQASHINASSDTDLSNTGKNGMMEWHAFSEYVYSL